jgi:hypothetical protein
MSKSQILHADLGGIESGFFFYLFWIIFFLLYIELWFCFHSTFYEIIMICCQIRSFNIWFFLFYHPTFDWLGIGLQAFFFSFLFPWSYFNLISVVTCLQVNSVWLVSIFLFFKFFIYFYPSTLGCLVTELHNFIQFAFNGVTLVSQSGRRFDMLTRMGSCWLFSYRFIVVKFFSSLFIIIAFFLFKLFKLIKFIKPGHINNLSLIYFFCYFGNACVALIFFLTLKQNWIGHLSTLRIYEIVDVFTLTQT